MADELKAIVEWLINISRELGSAATIEEALHTILENIKNHYPHQTLAVVVVDENTNNLIIKNSRNLSYSYVKNFTRLTRGTGTGGVTSVIDQLLLKHECVFLNNLKPGDPAYAEVKLEHDFNHVCLVPIIQNQRAIGYLHCDRVEGPLFTHAEARELLVIGYLIGQQIAKHELIFLTRHLARVDEASKALKYHAFLEQYRREIARAKTYGTPLSLILFSLDNYTQYVTTSGVTAGHALLEKVHRLIHANVREMDIVGRFAADQFIVCLGGMHGADARKTLADIHDILQKQAALLCGSPLTISGVSMTFERQEELNLPLEQIFARLGSGLIMARKQGRNQFVSVNPPAEHHQQVSA
jgi:diguanylate cyclase (GGDEF)-like protein